MILGTISGFLFVTFLSVLYDLIRREKGEIPFFPVNTVGHPSHCAPFLPSLPSVCSSFSTAACFLPLIQTSFYYIVHSLSFN